jgi:hypothetical protein
MSTGHKQETRVGLLNGQVTSARWRNAPPISAFGLFSRLVRAPITGKRRELGEECLQNTNSKPGLAYRLALVLRLGGAIYHRFPLPVLFCDSKMVITGQGKSTTRMAS